MQTYIVDTRHVGLFYQNSCERIQDYAAYMGDLTRRRASCTAKDLVPIGFSLRDYAFYNLKVPRPMLFLGEELENLELIGRDTKSTVQGVLLPFFEKGDSKIVQYNATLQRSNGMPTNFKETACGIFFRNGLAFREVRSCSVAEVKKYEMLNDDAANHVDSGGVVIFEETKRHYRALKADVL